MKPSLQLKQSQHLALTPQLQQSIRLLQLSTLELNQEIEQALTDNPLLERIDDPLGDCVRIAANGGLDDVHRPTVAERGDEQPKEDSPTTDYGSDWTTAEREGSDEDDRNYDWGGEGHRATGPTDEDEREYPQLASAERSLREHLGEQLAATRCTARDRALVQMLIDTLDDDGFLDSTLDDLAAFLPDELEISTAELSTALRLLQSFDPPGVGAADLRECLLLQIDALSSGGPPASDDQAAGETTRRLARAVVDQHLELLADNDLARLRRALRCGDDALRAAHALIRGLNPRPGAGFAGEHAGFVIPDVIVRRTRSGWTAVLNPDVMPKLRINDVYAQVLKRNRGAAPGMSGQLQEARWLIKNLQQRFDTILRVAQAIVDRQRAFFSHGAIAMRPLVLREIAELLDLHESTISRVTARKYMLTPFGTFELKYFFGSHVATDSGGSASSTAIRALIGKLVEAEDRGSPLSDGRIAELLAAQGFVVARRTVAKYRESLRIPTASRRKAL